MHKSIYCVYTHVYKYLQIHIHTINLFYTPSQQSVSWQMLCELSQYGMEKKRFFICCSKRQKFPLVHYTTFPLLIPNISLWSFLNLSKLHEIYYLIFFLFFFFWKLFSLVYHIFKCLLTNKTPLKPNHLLINTLNALTLLLIQNKPFTAKGSPCRCLETWKICVLGNVLWVSVAQRQNVNSMKLQKIFNFLIVLSKPP